MAKVEPEKTPYRTVVSQNCFKVLCTWNLYCCHCCHCCRYCRHRCCFCCCYPQMGRSWLEREPRCQKQCDTTSSVRSFQIAKKKENNVPVSRNISRFVGKSESCPVRTNSPVEATAYTTYIGSSARARPEPEGAPAPCNITEPQSRLT